MAGLLTEKSYFIEHKEGSGLLKPVIEYKNRGGKLLISAPIPILYTNPVIMKDANNNVIGKVKQKISIPISWDLYGHDGNELIATAKAGALSNLVSNALQIFDVNGKLIAVVKGITLMDLDITSPSGEKIAKLSSPESKKSKLLNAFSIPAVKSYTLSILNKNAISDLVLAELVICVLMFPRK